MSQAESKELVASILDDRLRPFLSLIYVAWSGDAGPLEIEEDETPACGPYHIGAARFEGADEESIRLVTDFRTNKNQLLEELRDFLEFGLKAATTPKEVTDEDVERIRRHDHTDEALVEIVSTALIAYNLASLDQVFNLEEGAG